MLGHHDRLCAGMLTAKNRRDEEQHTSHNSDLENVGIELLDDRIVRRDFDAAQDGDAQKIFQVIAVFLNARCLFNLWFS